MGTIITNVELTDAGADKFNRWFAAVAAPGVDLQALFGAEDDGADEALEFASLAEIFGRHAEADDDE